MKKIELIRKIVPLVSQLKMFYWSCDNYISEIYDFSSISHNQEKHKMIVSELKFFHEKYDNYYSGDNFISLYDNVEKLEKMTNRTLEVVLKQFSKELEMILEYHFWLIKIKKDLIKKDLIKK